MLLEVDLDKGGKAGVAIQSSFFAVGIQFWEVANPFTIPSLANVVPDIVGNLDCQHTVINHHAY